MQTRDEQKQQQHEQQPMPRVTEEAKKRKDEESRLYQTENRFTIQRRRIMSRLKKHWKASREALEAARAAAARKGDDASFTPELALSEGVPTYSEIIGKNPAKLKTRQKYGIVVKLLADDERFFYQIAPPVVDENTMLQEPAPAEETETEHGDRMWGESDDEEDITAADHRAKLEQEWAEFKAKYKRLMENGVLKKPNGKAYKPGTLKGYFEDNLKHDVLGLKHPHTFRSAVLDGHLFDKIVAKYIDSDEHTDKAQTKKAKLQGLDYIVYLRREHFFPEIDEDLAEAVHEKFTEVRELALIDSERIITDPEYAHPCIDDIVDFVTRQVEYGSDEDIAIRLYREYTGRATTYDDVYIMKQDVLFQPVHYDADKNYYDMNQGCLIINNLVKWTAIHGPEANARRDKKYRLSEDLKTRINDSLRERPRQMLFEEPVAKLFRKFMIKMPATNKKPERPLTANILRHAAVTQFWKLEQDTGRRYSMEEIKEFARSMGHSPYTNLKYRRHLPPSNDIKVGDDVEEIQSTQEAVDDENEQAEGSEGVLREAQQKLEEVLRQIANNDATIEGYYRLTLSPEEDDEDFLPHLRRCKKWLDRKRIRLENQISDAMRD